MFKGHQFVKLINENWVLDLTEYIGYKVKLDKDGNVDSYKQAFKATSFGEEIELEKNMRVPIKVLKEAANYIRNYEVDTDE